MSHQITKVDLIPNGDLSVCNVSQFDNGRVLPFEILENKEAYTFSNDIRVELHCRKADGNIVTLPSENITDNIVTFLSTTQLTACYGKNVCEIALYGPDDYLIGSGNFILDVEKSPTLGGINSTSEIHNLEEQIEEIATEIIGEDFYNKSEVDGLLALKANAADVYTKSQTDILLSAKANSSDVYTKGQVDTALSAKADTTYVDTEVDDLETAIDTKADASSVTAALATKADKSDTYTKEQVNALIDNIFPTLTASGRIVTFTTAIIKPLVNVTADVSATTVTACGVNMFGSMFEINHRWDGDGTYSSGVGNKNAGCPDKIPCNPSTTYCFVFPNYAQQIFMYLSEFDASKANIQKSSGMSINSTTHTVTFTTGANTFYMSFSLYATNDITETEMSEVGVNYPATDTSYHAYNGQTVPVADATTLTTISGVNNVYADTGEITVQYKYMSM